MRTRSLVMGLMLWCLAMLGGCVNSSSTVEEMITEVEAMNIALTNLDEAKYMATSSIIGPMEVNGVTIIAYEVTVNGGDSILLRYIDAATGELLVDRDATHALPITGDVAMAEQAVPENYYTSCPSGWPLCIANPASITFYSQNDPNWKNLRLNGGGGTDTFGQSGCLLSSYTMALRKVGRGTNNPYQLDLKGDGSNCYYTSSGVQSEAGVFISGSCIAGTVGASHTNISVDAVWSTLASGIPVVVHGYSNCLGGNHAQMIWGHDGSRYWTKDPWFDWSNQDQALCLSNPTYRVVR